MQASGRQWFFLEERLLGTGSASAPKAATPTVLQQARDVMMGVERNDSKEGASVREKHA